MKNRWLWLWILIGIGEAKAERLEQQVRDQQDEIDDLRTQLDDYESEDWEDDDDSF